MFDKFKIFYELVGKEKSQGQILCYFVFYTDYIEGVGTRKVIFSQKEVQYNELIIGHNYTFIEKNGKIEILDFYKLFRENFLKNLD